MNSYERVMATLAGQATDRPPVLAVLGAYGGRLTGVPLKQLYCDAKLYVAGQIALQDTFGLDLVLCPFDYGAIAEAFGGRAVLFDDQAPNMKSPAAFTPQEALQLPIPNPHQTGRLPMALEATARLADRYHGTVPVFAVVPGPTALPILLLGIEKWLETALFDEESAKAVLEYTQPFWLAWASALISTGADALVVTEGLAAAEITTPDVFRSCFLEHVCDSFSRLSAPLVFHHTGGRLNPALHMVRDLPNVVGTIVGSKDSLSEARRIIGPQLGLIGNLDNLAFPDLGPEELMTRAMTCLDQGVAGGPFILSNSGADIPIDTEPEVLHALRRATEQFAQASTASRGQV